ncbi:MAG: glycosyltransferase family 2 protein [Firmicutes bacterium]|jgi:glycosyltransferase involved in cell wall biosynthesis|nr:glycosyltransferase family 2 protein [Bacillota bacterium]
MKVTALIPAFNEAERIGETLTAVLEIKSVNQIVVIDDGSTDETASVVERYPVELIRLEKNQGKGGALNVGWQTYSSDIYLLLDADLKSSAVYAQALLKPVLDNEADMTIANLVNQTGSRGKMGFGIAKNIAKYGIKLLTGHELISPLSGQRAVTHQVLVDCGGFAPGFGVEAALTIQALRRGYRIVDIDLPMTHRATGRNWAGFRHRGRQLWAIVLELYKAWRNH